MSEYQYFEWMAIDHPLNEKEIQAVNQLSSHMDVVSATQAVVTYSWGSFKHKPMDVLLKHFDAFLYLSNWGSRKLMFRFPDGVLDTNRLQPYCLEDWITLTRHGEFIVLAMAFHEEGRWDWIEPQGTLSRMMSLREQILQGDYRCLYLAWLKAVTLDEPEVARAEPEPPVPAGMKELSGSLQAFIEIMEVDPHLIAAAAEASPEPVVVPEAHLKAALATLSREECEQFLWRTLQCEAQVGTVLCKRLLELSGQSVTETPQTKRLAGDLLQSAERLAAKARKQQQVEVEQMRIQELEELAKREEATWRWAEQLIEQKQIRPYQEATELLVKLRDLAIYRKDPAAFDMRYVPLRTQFSNRPALIRCFQEAGLPNHSLEISQGPKAILIIPSSYQCACGHQSHFSENTVKEAKEHSKKSKKKLRLGDSETNEHWVIYEKGCCTGVECPDLGFVELDTKNWL
jgi:hypothetical protein